MICNNADKCKSTECSHRMPHEYDAAFCKEGQCRWAGDTKCIPCSKREQLAALMMTDEWGRMTDAKAIDAIMEIFGEEENHE